MVVSLSTFFLSDDLRLLLAAPIPRGRLFLARFTRTVGQASWMVTMFLTPVLLGVGAARCAPFTYYAAAVLTVVPFATIPVALGAGATLLLVNVLPARRARDVLMLVGLLFAAALVLILRFIEPERLLRVESLPDIADFFANLQSPVMPLLPSFWAGESLFAELQGGRDLLHGAALWTTALACTVLLGAADRRWHFAGLQPVAGGREGACQPAARDRRGRASAAAVDGATPARRQGCEGVPPRRESVAAAPAAAARSCCSIFTTSARSTSSAFRT